MSDPGHLRSRITREYLEELMTRVKKESLVRIRLGEQTLVCLSEAAFLRLTERHPEPGHDGPSTRLSPRERQLLRMLGEGITPADIAAILGIANNTVTQHLVSIRRKFGVSTTHNALEKARRDGFID